MRAVLQELLQNYKIMGKQSTFFGGFATICIIGRELEEDNCSPVPAAGKEYKE